MHLSTRGRYAVMAMLDLAKIQQQKTNIMTVKLSEIAERQDISLSYLEQLFSQLRKAELVKSVRGPGGGYSLELAPKNIFISDIINAVKEPLKVTRCDAHTGGKGCVHNGACNAHYLWVAIGECVETLLKKINLEMVLNNDERFDINAIIMGNN